MLVKKGLLLLSKLLDPGTLSKTRSEQDVRHDKHPSHDHNAKTKNTANKIQTAKKTKYREKIRKL
jgi:hypothetical protein